MVLPTKSVRKFAEETNIFFNLMRSLLKVVFTKPTYCMRLSWSKMKGPRDFVQYNQEFVENHIH